MEAHRPEQPSSLVPCCTRYEAKDRGTHGAHQLRCGRAGGTAQPACASWCCQPTMAGTSSAHACCTCVHMPAPQHHKRATQHPATSQQPSTPRCNPTPHAAANCLRPPPPAPRSTQPPLARTCRQARLPHPSAPPTPAPLLPVLAAGKTHQALQALRLAGSGLYCGPLRLLACEVADRLNAGDTACHLVTGQEVKMVRCPPGLPGGACVQCGIM